MDDFQQALSKSRRDYDAGSLSEDNLDKDPVSQFTRWMDLALSSGIPEATAMTLSTVNAGGRPSSRIVLLKGVDSNGFVFFTNYESRKGRELNEHPYACLNFFWPGLEKQVRIEGTTEKLPENDSSEYFHSRPRESQIGAWTSHQSTVISGREELEKRFKDLEKKFEGKEVPKPDYWGGYVLIPDCIEFWQGRPGRLHDRFRYRLNENNWIIERLSP